MRVSVNVTFYIVLWIVNSPQKHHSPFFTKIPLYIYKLS